MINFFIFLFHFIFAVYIFFKVKKFESISAGFFNVVLIVILFAVGWAFLSFATQFFLDYEGYKINVNSDSMFWFIMQFVALWFKSPGGFVITFTPDKINLILLSIIEFFFYRNYYKDIIGGGKGK